MSERELANHAIQREIRRINTEIELITSAVSHTPDDHPNMPHLLGSLARSHYNRSKILGERNDINNAIQYMAMVLALTPDGDPDSPGWLSLLASYHAERFRRIAEVYDCDKAIEYGSLGLSRTPDGDSTLPIRFSNLGTFYSFRFQRLGALGDLETAIEYQSHALSLNPEEPYDLLIILSSLGVSLKDRFECQGELGDLDKAIEYQSCSLALAPDGHPLFSTQLANLGVSHTHRFNRLGELGDLGKAIEYKTRALALTHDGHPELIERLANLGVSHSTRYKRLGELGDLDKAIEYQSRALRLAPDGHPLLSTLLAIMGVSLKNRFKRLGELADLEKAIEFQTRGLALIPYSQPNFTDQLAGLTDLALSLKQRFEHLQELQDIEKAIEYESRAVALIPDGHPNLSVLLTNLASSHSARFGGSGELRDLEKAIEYQSRAITLTPVGHTASSLQLASLGSLHGDRFRHLRNQDDLEKSMEYTSNALKLIPDGHPDFPGIHFPLAELHLLQYQHSGDPSYLQDSLHCFRIASQSTAGSPREKFEHAIKWAEYACREISLGPIEAYQTAINLLPEFIWLGTTTIQRYEDLKSAENLAVDAALVAILSSDYALALEWLEHARCVVWNQNLMLRSPLDELYAYSPALATRLKEVAAQLHHAASESRESQALSPGSLTPEQVAQQRHQLAQEYKDLIAQARILPGFKDFLQPMKANSLVRAARNGPIVIINCHTARCDALIIMPERDYVDHVPLPNFTGKKAKLVRLEMEKSVRNSRTRERAAERRPVLEQSFEFENLLRVLWYDVVKPILDGLGCMNKSSSGNLPHITWCPTGALSFLPLHAAGDYNQPQSRVFDYAISSYTPTLNAILSSTPTSLRHDSRVLVIGQPNTPGHSPLPGINEELAYLKGHILGRAEYSQLVDNQATTTTVIDAMAQHDWVHLACHAHQSVQDPTKSGFFLHDDTLDLASINRQYFKNKGLAYLSACQTATGDKKLPDEAIHLASGMLMAGYSSVVATMWSVMDGDAPFIANQFYEELMKGREVGNGEAGKALHYAVGELRKKVGEKEFKRWVPYIHIGS